MASTPAGDEPRSAWVTASAVVFAGLSVGVCCGGLANTVDPDVRDRDWQVGTYRGQFCYYHRTSVAGATPPPLLRAVGPGRPVIAVHRMESNLAAYTLVAVPTWPLLAVVAWPALVWVGSVWRRRLLTRWHADRRGGTGFEPIGTPPDHADREEWP